MVQYIPEPGQMIQYINKPNLVNGAVYSRTWSMVQYIKEPNPVNGSVYSNGTIYSKAWLRLNAPTYSVPRISLIFLCDENKGISFT